MGNNSSSSWSLLGLGAGFVDINGGYLVAPAEEDLYCGSASKAVVTGATLCNSDYDSNKPEQKTVTIVVSTKTKSGKIAACKLGEDLKFKPE